MKLFITILSILPILVMVIKSIKNKRNNEAISKNGLIVAGVVSGFLFLSQFGLFKISSDATGHADLKIGNNLSPGQIIAYKDQMGKQATILMPGWHYDIRYPWVMDIHEIKDLVVPQGQIAILSAADGKINNDIVAPVWNEAVDVTKMITDFSYFVKNGGTRGIQQLKLPTGTYKINQFQWKIEFANMVSIQTGEVLVKESIFGKAPNFVETTDDEILAVPLVESSEYRGIVDKSHPAGLYGIHPYTEKANTVPVNLQTFSYKGGYISKEMEVIIDAENDKLKVTSNPKTILAGGHGPAFAAKTKDNHTVHIGVRVIGQVEPKQAPRFVGTIKDIKYLDDKIIEPYTKNILMNIVVKYTALELKDKRQKIGKEISDALRKRTEKTGFRTKTVEITNLDIPPIVLISGKIASASEALRPALVKKQEAVKEAIKVQNLQEQANKQKFIADAQVKERASIEEAKRIKTIADANFYKAQKQADASVYKIKNTAKAENYATKQQADAAKYLSEQIGKLVFAGVHQYQQGMT